MVTVMDVMEVVNFVHRIIWQRRGVCRAVHDLEVGNDDARFAFPCCSERTAQHRFNLRDRSCPVKGFSASLTMILPNLAAFAESRTNPLCRFIDIAVSSSR